MAPVPIVIARVRDGREYRPSVSTGSWAEVILLSVIKAISSGHIRNRALRQEIHNLDPALTLSRQNRAGKATKLSLIDRIRT